MAALAAGEDHREVVPDAGARSISQEQTFGRDLENPDQVRDVLLGQVEQVSRRLRRHGFLAGTVTVKIRYGNFETITRSRSYDEPTDRTDCLWEAGRTLFDRWTFQPVRLIGFGAANFTTGVGQLSLFDRGGDERKRALDRVTDSIHERFGSDAIRRGRSSG